MKQNTTITGENIPFSIKRSIKRIRSVSIVVGKEGVVVHAPILYSQRLINDFVDKKIQWIEKQWKSIQIKAKRRKKSFRDGSLLPYFGEKYPLNYRYWQKKSIRFGFSGEEFVVYTHKGAEKIELQKAFELWQKKVAEKYITTRTEYLAEKFELFPNKITVKKYTGKYGMCTKKEIYFSYTNIELPKSIIDHIILHELTHLIYKHHKPSFRNKLASMDKNWKKNRDYLKGKED